MVSVRVASMREGALAQRREQLATEHRLADLGLHDKLRHGRQVGGRRERGGRHRHLDRLGRVDR
eukprot:234142-Prymnesium_polylepis.1